MENLEDTDLLIGWKRKKSRGGEDELTGIALNLLPIESGLLRNTKLSYDFEKSLLSRILKKFQLLSDEITEDRFPTVNVHLWPTFHTEDLDINRDTIEPDAVIVISQDQEETVRIWIESKKGEGFDTNQEPKNYQLVKQWIAVNDAETHEEIPGDENTKDKFLTITKTSAHEAVVKTSNETIQERCNSGQKKRPWKWLSWKEYYNWIDQLIDHLEYEETNFPGLYLPFLNTVKTYMEKHDMNDFTKFDRDAFNIYQNKHPKFETVTQSIGKFLKKLQDEAKLQSACGDNSPFIRSLTKINKRREWVRSAYYFRLHPETCERIDNNGNCLYLLFHFFDEAPGMEIGMKIKANKINANRSGSNQDSTKPVEWLKRKGNRTDIDCLQPFTTNTKITTGGSSHFSFKEKLDWVKIGDCEAGEEKKYAGLRRTYDDFLNEQDHDNPIFNRVKEDVKELRDIFLDIFHDDQ